MSVIWGIPYLLIKVAGEGVSPSVLVFTRTALGALLLLPAALRTADRPWTALRGNWHWLLAFTAAEVLGPWWLLADAERRLSSSLSGLMIAAVPVASALLTLTIDGRAAERIGAKRWTGLLLGLASVVVLVLPGLVHGTGANARAVGEVLLVVIGYATGPMIIARKLAGVPGRITSTASLAIAAVVYAPIAATSWPQQLPTARVVIALTVLGAICTAGAFMFFFALIHEAGPDRALVFTYVNPAVAVTAGVLFLGEPLSLTLVGAFVLILGGSILATSRGKARTIG